MQNLKGPNKTVLGSGRCLGTERLHGVMGFYNGKSPNSVTWQGPLAGPV